MWAQVTVMSSSELPVADFHKDLAGLELQLVGLLSELNDLSRLEAQLFDTLAGVRRFRCVLDRGQPELQTTTEEESTLPAGAAALSAKSILISK